MNFIIDLLYLFHKIPSLVNYNQEKKVHTIEINSAGEIVIFLKVRFCQFCILEIFLFKFILNPI